MVISPSAGSPVSVQNLFQVNGLVALITGGGSGLGAYAARALDENGAKAVYIVGRREASLKAVAASGSNKSIIPLVGDVTDKNSLSSLVEQVRKEQGYLNFLFVNAGVFALDNDEFPPPKTANPSIEEFQKVAYGPPMDKFGKNFNVNVVAAYYTAIAFAQLLDAGNQKGNTVQKSQILINSSIGGYIRETWEYSYSTSKAAATTLSKSLATRLAQWQIRVNCIAPGFYPSEMADRILPTDSIPAGEPFQGARYMTDGSVPLGRTGSEEDFAGAILFLASKAGAFINGNILITDGGSLAVMPTSY